MVGLDHTCDVRVSPKRILWEKNQHVGANLATSLRLPLAVNGWITQLLATSLTKWAYRFKLINTPPLASLINVTLITVRHTVMSAHKISLEPIASKMEELISQMLIFIYSFQDLAARGIPVRVFRWELTKRYRLILAGWTEDYLPVGEEATWTELITLSEMLYHFMFAGSLFWKFFPSAVRMTKNKIK